MITLPATGEEANLKRPLVSVVIPVFNPPPERLQACLASVFSQSHDDWEMIVVDDGSTDRAVVQILDGLQEQSGVRLLTIPNSGVSVARNLGTSHVRGEYVLYLDADDEVTPCVTRDIKRIHDHSNPDVIMGYLQDESSYDAKGWECAQRFALFTDESVATLRDEFLLKGAASSIFRYGNSKIKNGPVARAVKRELAQRVAFPENVKVSEDTLWNMELFRLASSVAVSQSVWYTYWTVVGSASRSIRWDAAEQTIQFLTELNRKKKAYPQAYSEQFLTHWTLNELNRAVKDNYSWRLPGRPYIEQVRLSLANVRHPLVKQGLTLSKSLRLGWKHGVRYLFLRTGVAVPYWAWKRGS